MKIHPVVPLDVSLRLVPPSHVICADLVGSIGYSVSGVSTAFRRYPSYVVLVSPFNKRGIAAVDLADAKDWLEKKSESNPQARIVLTSLSDADFDLKTTMPQDQILPETHTEAAIVSNDTLRPLCEVMAELKEARRRYALFEAESKQRRALFAQCRAEIEAAQAEIEFHLNNLTLKRQ